MKKTIKLLFLFLLLSSNAFALKIGYINTEVLFSESAQFQAAQQEIASEFKAKDDKLKLKAEKIKKLLANFKEIKEDLTKNEIKEQVEMINKLDRELQADAAKIKKQFDLRNQEELQKIQDTLNLIIAKFAKENNFDLILYREVAFVADKLDITKQISKKLAAHKN